ncbi:Protein CL16A [Dipsacomyces acuminosporus]|nr:Protein CL16A [Dipsacomyces acuminosporus]
MFNQFLNAFGLQNNTGEGATHTATHTVTHTATPAAAAEDSSITTEQRRLQIQNLSKYLSSVKTGKHQQHKKIVESVRQVSEIVIWCDRKQPELLSYVIEVDIHKALLRLLSEQNQTVAVQILQTLSIILDGITDKTFLYSLFSNNFVNELIAAPLDLDNDEVLAYYVAFLKALSLKLTTDTIHFFFNERLDDFPLYSTAISLFDHPDSMDCYDDAFRILIDMPNIIPSTNNTNGGKATTVIDNSNMTELQEWTAINQILENHMGLLAYLNDIYGLGVERINKHITEEFVDRILVRTFVHVIDIGWRANATPEESLFMQVVTLFLSHFFAIIKHSPLLADTMNALFRSSSTATPMDPKRLDEASEATSAALSDHYGGDDNSSSVGRSSGIGKIQIIKDDYERQSIPISSHLDHPFTPSPFESSRTLIPWLCLSLEILLNKAIGPTTLVKSVLLPRRMLRTRNLLESLTGLPSLPDYQSSSIGSVVSSTPNNPSSSVTTGTAPLFPAPTQSILTSLVQILTDTPPSHNWVTIDLAALLLLQLAQNAKGGIQLDAGLTEELVQSQSNHSAELRSKLVSHDTDDSDLAEKEFIALGSWKILVKCLVDLANTNSQTLRNKIESESNYIFSLDRPTTAANLAPSLAQTLGSDATKERQPQQSVMQRLAFIAQNRKSSASSATCNPQPPNQQLDKVYSPVMSSRASIVTASTPSPFDTDAAQQEMALLATVHQAFYLKKLCQSTSTPPTTTPARRLSSPTNSLGDWLNSRGLYIDELAKWLGASLPATEDGNNGSDNSKLSSFEATVIDSRAKRALPKGMIKLGFPAQVACQNGCMIIRQLNNSDSSSKEAELIWPLADVSVVEMEPEGVSESPYRLRLSDPPFPELFFPARPRSMGGININSLFISSNSGGKMLRSGGFAQKPRSKSTPAGNSKLLLYSYFGSQFGLDIVLRFADKLHMDLAKVLLQKNAQQSRHKLARIYLDYQLI